MAIFYRKQSKYLAAIKFIEKSLSICPTGEGYLNLCSILSLQLKYDKALEIAMHAIIFIQDEIFEELFEEKKMNERKVETLAAAYYNLAVQLEFLKRSDEANSYYKKSIEFSDKYLNNDNVIKAILKQIYDKIMTGSGNKYEYQRKTELGIRTQNMKRRIVIKNSNSKSPIAKNTPSSRRKVNFPEKIQQKLDGPCASHRKFVKTGVTKAKLIESIIPAPDKEDSSEDELIRDLTSARVFNMNYEENESKNKYITGDCILKSKKKKEEEKKSVVDGVTENTK